MGNEVKKNKTVEEELKELMNTTDGDTSEDIDRFVDLLIDLIAERSEEKADEVLENHKTEYDHDLLWQV